MFEAVGAFKAGKMGEHELAEYEERSCPSCGSCSGMFTANSMNCLTEAPGDGFARERDDSGRVFSPDSAGESSGDGA